jgi:hypothetical protein
MLWYEVQTNYRTFAIEAAGIGDAIDRALNMIESGRGEYLRTVEAMLVVTQVAA